MSPSFPPTSQLQEPSPLPAASQRLPLPGWLRRGVAKSVPFLAPQSNVVSFRLFSPPSSQTPYSQKCPFASRPPVHAPSMQLCLRSLGALRCAYCRGRPMRRPSTLKKKKKKKRKKRKKRCYISRLESRHQSTSQHFITPSTQVYQNSKHLDLVFTINQHIHTFKILQRFKRLQL